MLQVADAQVKLDVLHSSCSMQLTAGAHAQVSSLSLSRSLALSLTRSLALSLALSLSLSLSRSLALSQAQAAIETWNGESVAGLSHRALQLKLAEKSRVQAKP